MTHTDVTASSKPNYSQALLKTSSKIKSILVNDSRKSKDKNRILLTEPSERCKPKVETRKLETLFNKKVPASKEKSAPLKELCGKDKYSFEGTDWQWHFWCSL